jgi:hypothetical protein
MADPVGRALDHPAYRLLGGYYIMFRRAFFIVWVVFFFLISYELLWQNAILAAIITGGSIGPFFLLEQKIALHLLSSNKTE